MVYPDTCFIGDSGAFLCIPMKTGVKSEHCEPHDVRSRFGPRERYAGPKNIPHRDYAYLLGPRNSSQGPQSRGGGLTC
jgi:hypothetical protein